ncbi:hypothetical protein LCGC14_1330510 [marine sediment metagenome]|uniref:Uncharacterized protein n=1 Tax=marine sediment metagenome TaxID=412755 RepID=A0A0F9MXM4_9ZZZZ
MARKVSDPLALAVRAALSKILKRKAPYSSARISARTVHRTSWGVHPKGLDFKRYPTDDQITLRELKIINKFVANVREKLARAIAPLGYDMSKVTVGWHFGTGLYLNVRVVLKND